MSPQTDVRVMAASVLAMALFAGACPGAQQKEDAARSPRYRGVAVLSSSIGHDVSGDELLALVRTCKLNLLVIDFAWVTYHWPRTDLAAVAQLAQTLHDAGVETALMYRPRAMNRTDADVHYAADEKGALAEHHNELCFAYEDSCGWAAQWGTRLLRACPTCDRVVLYNVRATCHCPRCRAGKGPEYIAGFLDHCRAEWQQTHANVLIGHVGVADEYAAKVDFLCPFIAVQRDGENPVDAEALVGQVRALRSRVGDVPLVPLIKTCWAEATHNTTDDIARVVRACDAADTGFVLWYYEWLFHEAEQRYDARTLLQTMGGDWQVMAPYLTQKPRGSASQPAQNTPSSWVYFDSKESPSAHKPELVLKLAIGTRRIPVSADTNLIGYLADRAWGQLPRLAVNLADSNRVLLRFDLSAIKKNAALTKAELVLSMHNSEAPVVAPFDLAVHTVSKAWSESSATWKNQPAFREAPDLVVAVDPKDPSLRLDVTPIVKRWLAGEVPNHGVLLKVARPLSAALPGGTAESVPKLTPPPAESPPEKLPWPHQAPGLGAPEIDRLNREVWVINNYPLYQADEEGTMRYFHSGLDIVVDNGTKIYAMKDGWVRAVTHSSIFIADRPDEAPSYGWEYTHLGDFQVKPGDSVKRGTFIGKVDFQGLPHIHLAKVYCEGQHWGSWHYACTPAAHFTPLDTEPPVIQRPFLFFRNDTDERICPDDSGNVVLGGEVDIVVGMRDGGQYARSRDNGFGDRLAVAAIDYEVRPVDQPERTPQRYHSFDFRKLPILCGTDAPHFNAKLTRVVYKHSTLCEPKRRSGDKTLSYYIITNCAGDQPPTELSLSDRAFCWNAGALDGQGNRCFPDGTYEIIVTARDFAGNESTAKMPVRIAQQEPQVLKLEDFRKKAGDGIRTHDVQLGNAEIGAQPMCLQGAIPRFGAENEVYNWVASH